MVERPEFRTLPRSWNVRRRSPCPHRVRSRHTARRVHGQVAENVAIRRRGRWACNRIRDAAQSSVCTSRCPSARLSNTRPNNRPHTCAEARTLPHRTVATRRTRPITGVGGFGKEKCGDGRARRNIPARTGNEPMAGDASEIAMSVGTHLSQQTPPEESVTGVREGDAKLCRGGRRGSRFDAHHRRSPRTTLRMRKKFRFSRFLPLFTHNGSVNSNPSTGEQSERSRRPKSLFLNAIHRNRVRSSVRRRRRRYFARCFSADKARRRVNTSPHAREADPSRSRTAAPLTTLPA